MAHDRHLHSFSSRSSGLTERESRALRLLDAGTSFRKIRVIKMERELPRLTSALREFGGVSSRLSREPVSLNETAVRRKREKKKNDFSDDQKSWGMITEEVVAQCSKQDVTKVRLHGCSVARCAFIR